jgi:uncharacterized phage protein (TIGR02218 family)
MKTLPGALATHVAQPTTTLAHALRITRTDGQVFGFTSADTDVTISSVLYESAPGLVVSSIATSAGLNVDNLELSTLDDGTVFNRTEVLAGLWNNAAFSLFRYNWASPSDGIDTLMAGTLGEVTLRRSTIVAELRGLQQYLQQPVGNVSTKTCRARFADYPVPVSDTVRCRLTAASFTFAGTVTTATSNQQFTATALTQAADYFGEGIVVWTSGPNANLSQKVKAHTTGGVITLSLPMLFTVAVGHTFDIIAGCRKRLDEDCDVKFSNVLNFQGEPHAPTVDAFTAAPEVGV